MEVAVHRCPKFCSGMDVHVQAERKNSSVLSEILLIFYLRARANEFCKLAPLNLKESVHI
jgi:hypothetical protein